MPKFVGMKRILLFLSAVLLSVAAFAQTPEEIVRRMDAEMDKHEAEGLIMTCDTKVPILGTMRVKTYTLGNKVRLETAMMGVSLVSWEDGTTEWTYASKTHELTIKNLDPAGDSNAGDEELFSGITDGYSVKIQKETADAWYIACKKLKTNTNKDDPKTMDLVVSKQTYLPLSLKAKVSGVGINMHDISFGVSDDFVTFHPEDYPDAKVVDKR